MGFGLLFDTLGNIISTVLNVYGSYMQIEDKSDNRPKYEHHEYHHYHRNEMPDIKKILEETLIPDIKATTEVVRDVMNDFAQSTQQITSQIQRELIPTVKYAINVMEKESLSFSHDIKATTEVVRDVMNDFAQSTQQITSPIQRELIPMVKYAINVMEKESLSLSHDIKATTEVVRDVMNDFAQSTQQITSPIQRELIPMVKYAINVMEKISLSLSHDIKATTEVVRDVMNDFAQSTQQITSPIQRELIPTVKYAINVMEKESLSLSHDIKATTEVVRDVMNELAHSTQEMTKQIQQESQLLSRDVQEFIPVATQVMELGLIFLLLGIAGLCRYELNKIESMPGQKWIHRLEKIMVYFLRYICISYGVMRFVIVLVLKQTEPMSSWIVLLSIAPAFICMTIGVLRKVNVQQTLLLIVQRIKQITLSAILHFPNNGSPAMTTAVKLGRKTKQNKRTKH